MRCAGPGPPEVRHFRWAVAPEVQVAAVIDAQLCRAGSRPGQVTPHGLWVTVGSRWDDLRVEWPGAAGAEGRWPLMHAAAAALQLGAPLRLEVMSRYRVAADAGTAETIDCGVAQSARSPLLEF